MKNLIRLLLLTIIVHPSAIINCHAQAGEWTWMKGDSTFYSSGSYGVKGVPSPTNEPPSNYACGYWTDSTSNFWIYGGATTSGAMGDMWKFDPQTIMWTWMNGDSGQNTSANVHAGKGVYDPQNSPGALGFGMFNWVTPDNHLWLFGGNGNSGLSPLLWQYDPGINQWAWMGTFGPVHYGTRGVGDTTTVPGGRYEGNCAWTDSSGNLWLFGGGAFGSLNDVWEYNIKSGIWSWLSGSSNPQDSGSYGIIGQASVSNYPSARRCNLFWKDAQGNFWLAGGGDNTDRMMFGDIWKFNPTNLQWTWVKGIKGNDTVTIGVDCTPDTLNEDGPRYENRASWHIWNDLVITYNGFTNWYPEPETNDLWAYKMSCNEWIKIRSWPFKGYYGTKGLTDAANYPPSRIGSVGFKDKDNNLWMFAGRQYDSLARLNGQLNDLWKYVPDSSCIGSFSCNRNCFLAAPFINTNERSFCSGDSAQICAPSGYSSYQWNDGVTGSGYCIYAKQSGDYYVNVSDTNGCTAESNHISISVYPVPSVSITQKGDTLSSFGQSSYQWLRNGTLIDSATNSYYVALQSGSYAVQVTDTNGCTTVSNPVFISGIQDLAEENISIYPNPSAGNWQLTVGNELLGSEMEVYDEQGRLLFHSLTFNLQSVISLPRISPGIYYLRLSNDMVSVVRKLVKL